jgi:hypothetical protein
MLPLDRRNEGEKTTVRGTDTLPETRSAADMRNKETEMQGNLAHKKKLDKDDGTDVTVPHSLVTVVLSPSCKSKTKCRQPETRLHRTKKQPPQNKDKEHHLAVFVVSPARDPAADGHRTGMQLQTTRHVAITSPSHLPTTRLSHTQPSHSQQNTKSNITLTSISHKHQPCPRITIMSYPAQSNHRNTAAQSGNRLGRQCIIN